jgi:hypothetical protein
MEGSMRAHLYCIALALAATLMGEFGVSALDWQTVDDFALAGGNAEARGVAVDAAGRVYVVGTANGHAIVRYSSDGGTTWSTRDDFVYPSEINNLFNAITITPEGDVFVGGSSEGYVGGIEAGHWIVRRSTDQGVSWQTVDDYYRPMIDPSHPGTNGVVYSLSSDRQGRVYGAGLLLPSGPSYLHWWVRGSDIGGTNWDTKLVIFSGYIGVSQLTWAGEDIYVSGAASDSVITSGLMLRSSDQGATWSTNFVAANEIFPAITADLPGNIYAAGNSSSSNSYYWVVSKAAPGGTNWTVLDTIQYGDLSESGNQQASPVSIAVDPAGNLSVAGRLTTRWIISSTNGTTYGANQSWFTRQYSAALGQWNTTDVYSYSTNATSSTNTHAIAKGTAIAANGTTFVVGYGSTESGQHRWVVRKRAAVRPPPRLQIASVGGIVSVSWDGAYTNSILEWTDSPGTNQLWQTVTGPVSKAADGQSTVNLEVTPGVRFFRLRNTAGQ